VIEERVFTEPNDVTEPDIAIENVVSEKILSTETIVVSGAGPDHGTEYDIIVSPRIAKGASMEGHIFHKEVLIEIHIQALDILPSE
jgi:hypothetical protein